ncbi:MAG: OmpA family protein [Cytophagales bacterium]
MNINKILLSLFLSFIASSFAQKSLEPTEDSAQVIFKVIDPKGVPEQGAKVIVDGLGFKFKKIGISDVDGKFITLMPEGYKFQVTVEKFGKKFVFDKPDDIIEIPKMDGEISFEQNLAIAVITKYLRIFKIENLYFDSNKWDLKKDVYGSLDMVYEQMKSNPIMKVEIAGHTDNVGDDESNMRLSQNRANSVKEYIVKKGITPDRIIAKGYGESSPVESNDTEVGRAMNRRTEVRVITE